MENKRKLHRIKYKNANDKKNYIKRLCIIEGQIRGITQMIEDDRFCDDILIQISSAEQALRSLSNNILENHMRTCMTEEVQKGNLEIIDEIMNIVKRNK